MLKRTQNFSNALASGRPAPGLSAAAREIEFLNASAMSAERHQELIEEAEALSWSKPHEEQREKNIDNIKSSEGVTDFKFGESLRLSWLSHQRADKEVVKLLESKAMPDGCRIGTDGVLEREVKLPPPCGPKWVPVVPDGHCLRNMTWKDGCSCRIMSEY